MIRNDFSCSAECSDAPPLLLGPTTPHYEVHVEVRPTAISTYNTSDVDHDRHLCLCACHRALPGYTSGQTSPSSPFPSAVPTRFGPSPGTEPSSTGAPCLPRTLQVGPCSEVGGVFLTRARPCVTAACVLGELGSPPTFLACLILCVPYRRVLVSHPLPCKAGPETAVCGADLRLRCG